MTKSELAASTPYVKEQLEVLLSEAIACLGEAADKGGGQRTLELEVWRHLVAIGKALLVYAFARRCLRSTEADLGRRGCSRDDVRLRSDAGCYATLTTTCGEVSFPTCAYRDDSGPLPVTRTPARADFLPSYGACRSSELCLEWETKLGASLPFRKAQADLAYFTHGAARLEDTSLARHMVTIGAAITRDWLYLTPERIAEVLRDRATRDQETTRPILYVSSDAVALRRYVDDTWTAAWKMANGIRLWCIDRESGATIHIGGEYTFGDCEVVEAAITRLIEQGHLPRDGRYPSVQAQLVFITDGMPWLQERILNQFTDAIAILDLYHVLEHVAEYAAARHGKGTSAAKRLYATFVTALLGSTRQLGHARRPKARKGHSKRPRASLPSHRPPYEPLASDRVPPAAAVLHLLHQKDPTSPRTRPAVEAREALIAYVERNADRMDYMWFRSLGYHIGSGAMESLHRTAAQDRLKKPGARWLRETAEAIFSLRMLSLVGRENEFWNQPDLTQWLQVAFAASANDDAATRELAA